jgi:hypothetical protein
VRPLIEPFVLPGAVQAGQRLAITCTVVKGDPPIRISWKKDNTTLVESGGAGLRIHHMADYSSTLLFESLRAEQAGDYSCSASNAAGEAAHCATLVVHTPPRWAHEPADVNPIAGEPVWVHCQAGGVPTPTISWKKAESKFAHSTKVLVLLVFC